MTLTTTPLPEDLQNHQCNAACCENRAIYFTPNNLWLCKTCAQEYRLGCRVHKVPRICVAKNCRLNGGSVEDPPGTRFCSEHLKLWRQEVNAAGGDVPSSEEENAIDRPKHYRQHPSGVECITITEHMSFLLGNVIKYVWRADLKGGVEDLKKARWYLEREIEKRESDAEN